MSQVSVAASILKKMEEAEFKSLKELYQQFSDKFYPGPQLPDRDGLKGITKFLNVQAADLVWARENDLKSFTKDFDNTNKPGYSKVNDDDGTTEWYFRPSNDGVGVYFATRLSNGSFSFYYVVVKSRV